MEDDRHILNQIDKSFELRSKNKTIDIFTDPHQRTKFLSQEIENSLEYNPLKDRFALSRSAEISLGISFLTSATIAYLVKKSLNTKLAQFRGFATIMMPGLLGCASSIYKSSTNEKLYKLEQNCRECFRIKTCWWLALFPGITSFIFSTGLNWITSHDTLDSKFFDSNNQTKTEFFKKLRNNYHLKMQSGNVYVKCLITTLGFVSIAYLVALEEEREFSIIFTRYYNSLKVENYENDNNEKAII